MKPPTYKPVAESNVRSCSGHAHGHVRRHVQRHKFKALPAHFRILFVAHMLKYLVLLCLVSNFRAWAQTPTYNRDVAPILQNKCQSCHQPGGLAPFPLIQFSDAKNRDTRIEQAVSQRRMPPWPPKAGCGEFRNERSLSLEDIQTVQRWVSAGSPEGDPKDLPAPLPPKNGWILGPPDLTLASENPFEVPSHGHDVYRCFILPYLASQNEFITGLELKPDQASIVHHGIIYLDPNGDSLKQVNPKDPQAGYDCFGGAGFDSAVLIGGWAPGAVPEFLPEGVGIPMPKGSRLVLQIHYHLKGQSLKDQTQLGVHFARKPIAHPLTIGALYDSKNLKIPAGQADYKISKEMTLDRDIEVLNVFPHMHLLGQSISLEAILPDFTQQCLIRIDQWNFHWQGFYSYKKPIVLPKGTRLKLTGTYDNSEANPHQFNHPPKDVSWGEQTTDEMFLSFFGYIEHSHLR